jgi:hypothetical protein
MLTTSKITRIFTGFALFGAVLAAGCDTQKDDGTDAQPRVVGEAPADAAEVIADTMCDYLSSCGEFVVACASSTDGSEGGCTVEHEQLPYDECVAEFEPEIRADLECVGLTDEEAAIVEECLAALVSQPCPTFEEVQDAANGQNDAGSEVWSPPPACEQAEAFFARCDQAEPGETEPAPAPAPEPTPEPEPAPEPPSDD